MQYVEFHARSAFSFLEGASHPEALSEAAAQLGMPAMALLDRDGVYGATRFHLRSKKMGIKAHIGAELSLKTEGRLEGVRLPVIAATLEGYQNLCRIITNAKLRHGTKEEHVAIHSEEDFADKSAGLICLTGDEKGPLAHALRKQNGATDEARQYIERLIRIFEKENVYVELQRHYDRSQEARNQKLIDLAREYCLPLLATNGVSYATPAEREVLDAFTCLRYKKQLSTAGRLLYINAERHLRAAEEMERLFADLPESIANTTELSSRIEFSLENLGYSFPQYPLPPGETPDSFLHKRAFEGAGIRYRQISSRITRQLERELKLIANLKLAGYFLIVWDIVRFCNQSGILVQGRGSAANSAVCYSLGITAVDPIGMDLLFERFLSEERGEWPDIDLDLPSGDARESVIQHVYRKYGERGAAMTANVITYRGRSAAREMGKVLGFNSETVGRLSGLIGAWEWRDPKDTLDGNFVRAGFDVRNPQIQRFMSLCERVRDLPRHLGQHSGGMVVCQGQLDAVVPLEPASMPGRVVVQWDKDDCSDLGIVKVDLLGLGMMAVLEESQKLISKHYGQEIDLAHLPADDPETYSTIQKADTVGMFQIESRAQMASLPRNCPKRFYDLVVQVALIRPGPIVGHMTNPYLKRRQGLETVTYPHPSLEPILERTLGVPLFQEQLLRMAMVCANFTGGEAEELRKAVGNKRSKQRMLEIEVKLRAGMTQNQIDPATQEEIVRFISSFALYGFPESHAASFALIAYASAYLKCHYLAAFTAALINNYPMGFYHPDTLIKDAKRHGLRFKPIDATRSNWECTLEQSAGEQSAGGKHESELCLRLGLKLVRGLSKNAAGLLVKERECSPFYSVEELHARLPELTKDNLQMLAQVGALNNIGADKLHRRDALWQVAKASQYCGPLFSHISADENNSPLERMTAKERLTADYFGTGVTLDRHPLSYHRERLKGMKVLSAAELSSKKDGALVKFVGAVIVRQRPGTAQGFIFLSMEDETGIANIIITPQLYDNDRMVVLQQKFLVVEGVLQNKENVVHLKATRLKPFDVQGESNPEERSLPYPVFSRDWH
jgi:error-prone DNA polymerase